MLLTQELDSSVYECGFIVDVKKAQIQMKFPCSYFVEWKSLNGRFSVATQKHKPQDQQVVFNQSLEFTTQMIYDNKKLEFLKKETLILLNLTSKSRPEQVKLVGRVTVDLSKIANFDMYAQPTEFRLNFCSVEGTLTLQFKTKSQRLTKLNVHDLDRSSFIDYLDLGTIKNSLIGLQNQLGKETSQTKVSKTASKSLQKRKQADLIQQKSERKNEFDSQKLGLKDKNFLGMNAQKVNPSKLTIQNTPSFSHDYQQTNSRFFQNLTHQVSTKKLFPYDSISQPKNDALQPIISKNNFQENSKLIENKYQGDYQMPSKPNENLQNDINKKATLRPLYISPILNSEEVYAIDAFKVTQIEPGLKIKNEQQIKQSEEVGQLSEVLPVQSFLNTNIRKDNPNLNQNILQEMQKLKRENKNLQILIQSAHQERDQYSNQLSRLRKENNHIKQILNKFEDESKSYLEKLSNQKNIGASLKQKLQSCQEQLGKVKIQIRKVDDLTRQSTYYQLQVESLVKQLHDLQRINQRQKTQHDQVIAIITRQNTELSIKIEVLDRDLKILQEGKEVKEKIQSHQNEEKDQAADLKKRLWVTNAQISQKNKYLQETILELTSKTENIATNLSIKYQRQIQQYQNQVEKNVEANQTLKKTIRLIERKNGELIIENEIINKKYKQLLMNQQKSKDQVVQIKNSIKSQKQVVVEVIQIQRELVPVDQIQELKWKYTDLSDQLQSLKLLYDSNVSELQSLSDKYRQLEIENYKSQQQLISAQEKNRQNEKFINSLQERQRFIDSRQKLSTKDRQALEQKIQSLELLLSQQSKEYSLLLQKRKEIEVQLVIVRNNLQQISDKLKITEQNMSHVNQSLQQQINKNHQLNETIMKYMEKQAKLKETLSILEEESKEIIGIVQQKEDNEEKNLRIIQEKEKKISQYQAQLQKHRQQFQQLKQLIKEKRQGQQSYFQKLEMQVQIKKLTNLLVKAEQSLKSKDQRYDQILFQPKQGQENLQQEVIIINKKEIEELKRLLNIKTQELASKQELQKILEGKKKESRRVQDEKKQLQVRLIDTQNQLENLNAQMIGMTIINSQQTRKLEDQVAKLTEQIESKIRSKDFEQNSEVQQKTKQFEQQKDNYELIPIRQELLKKVKLVKQLQEQLKSARIQASKAKDLERSLKIKSIQVETFRRNRLKTMGNDQDHSETLLKLKQEQLNLWKEKMSFLQRELELLNQQKNQLQLNLQILEEQKFNIQSSNNEKEILLLDIQQQNRQLIKQINTANERLAELEQMTSQFTPQEDSSAPIYKKYTVGEVEQARHKLQEELQIHRGREQQYIINILDLQLKIKQLEERDKQGVSGLKKGTIDGQSNYQTQSQVIQTFQQLRSILDRRSSYWEWEELLKKVVERNSNGDQFTKTVNLQEKARLLSKQFQKFKAQLLKGEGRGQQEKIKHMAMFKPCEGILNELISCAQGLNLNQSSFL